MYLQYKLVRAASGTTGCPLRGAPRRGARQFLAVKKRKTPETGAVPSAVARTKAATPRPGNYMSYHTDPHRCGKLQAREACARNFGAGGTERLPKKSIGPPKGPPQRLDKNPGPRHLKVGYKLSICGGWMHGGGDITTQQAGDRVATPIYHLPPPVGVNGAAKWANR